MFIPAKQKINQTNALNNLFNELKLIDTDKNNPFIFLEACKFFNAVVNFQDNCALNTKLFSAKVQKDIKILKKHIVNAGRNEYGIVRAPRGEMVHMENLFLGNTHGLNTKTAAYWDFECRDSEAKEIIKTQLINFMNSHIDPMLQIISKLKAAQKPLNILDKMELFVNSKRKTK